MSTTERNPAIMIMTLEKNNIPLRTWYAKIRPTRWGYIAFYSMKTGVKLSVTMKEIYSWRPTQKWLERVALRKTRKWNAKENRRNATEYYVYEQ